MSERISDIRIWVNNNQDYLQGKAKAAAEKQAERHKRFMKKSYATNIAFRESNIWQCRLGHYMRVPLQKDKKTRFGCSVWELRAHFESQFSPLMCWENYGKLWEVDHVVPVSRFDLPRELFSAFHYTNLRPRLVALNRIDGRKAGNKRRII